MDFASDEPAVLKQFLTELKAEKLVVEKQRAAEAEEFGKQRGIFKQLLLNREAELRQQTESRNQLQAELDRVREQLDVVRSDADSLRSMATVIETSSREESESIRRHYEEELASLRHILEVNTGDVQENFAQLEQERSQWRRTREQLEAEITKLRSQVGAGRMSPMTWRKRSGTPDESMDSVRQENRQLQEQVRQLTTQLKASKGQGSRKTNLAAKVEDILSSLGATSLSDEALEELQKALDFKKCSRSDLEMYLSALITQKFLLQEEMNRLRSQLEDKKKIAQHGSSNDLLLLDTNDDSVSATPLMPLSTLTSSTSPEQNGGLSTSATNNPASVDLLLGDLPSMSESSPTAMDFTGVEQFLAGGSLSVHRDRSLSDIAHTRREVSLLRTEPSPSPELDELRKQCTQLTTTLGTIRAEFTESEAKRQLAEAEKQVAVVKRDGLQEELDSCKTELKREKKQRLILEGLANQTTNELTRRINDYQSQQSDVDTIVEEVRQSYAILQDETHRHVVALRKERDKLFFQLETLQRSYAHLEMALSSGEQTTDGPDKAAGQIASSPSHGSSNELRSSPQLRLVDKQVKPQSSLTISQRNESLDRQLQEAHLEIARLRSSIDAGTETQNQNPHMADGIKALQAKTKETILALQQKLQEESEAREKVEAQIQEKRSQMENLRGQLNSSQSVQADLASFCQRLQVQLEEMTAKQREVRWEHEKDVSECRSCQVGFKATQRKHHCRQCGKIFCGECSSKTVTRSESSQPLRVCDRCYDSLNSSMPLLLTEEEPNQK